MAHPAFHTTWHGTPRESRELRDAIARHCACEIGPMGVRVSTCAPHQLLAHDQRALDGLLFARRIAERLRVEEGIPVGSTAGAAA